MRHDIVLRRMLIPGAPESTKTASAGIRSSLPLRWACHRSVSAGPPASAQRLNNPGRGPCVPSSPFLKESWSLRLKWDVTGQENDRIRARSQNKAEEQSLNGTLKRQLRHLYITSFDLRDDGLSGISAQSLRSSPRYSPSVSSMSCRFDASAISSDD